MDNIFELLQPWKSHVMSSKPWAFPIYLLVMGCLLSLITWIRYRKIKKSPQKRDK